MSRNAEDVEQWRHLRDRQLRAQLTLLRQAVEPILANNILHHFTDHSVAHSDSVCATVDDLIQALQAKRRHKLTPAELFVLYAACYLHDIGMQFEAAGKTATVTSAGVKWDELDENAKRAFLRDKHHLLSAEIVASLVRKGSELAKIPLDDEDAAEATACLCEVHCVTPETSRYAQLTAPRPRHRMPLLAGLLRLADILDESSHRAQRSRARTLELDMVSQSHWWRHYYTRDVVIDSSAGRIVLYFSFPAGRIDEYERIVPELQIPWIEQELQTHRPAFAHVGLSYVLSRVTQSGPYSSVEVMPDDVLAEMVSQLQRRRTRQREQAKRILAVALKDAKPLFQRRLDELEGRRSELSSDDYIGALARLAAERWTLGSRRSAWSGLIGPFERAFGSLSESVQLDVGTVLLRMLIEDGVPRLAGTWASSLREIALKQPHSELKQSALEALSEWYALMCDYESWKTLATTTLPGVTGAERHAKFRAIMLETHLLQGEIDAALTFEEEQ